MEAPIVTIGETTDQPQEIEPCQIHDFRQKICNLIIWIKNVKQVFHSEIIPFYLVFGLCFISSFVWDCLRFLFLVRIPIYSSLTLFSSIKKVERKTRQKVDESMNL